MGLGTKVRLARLFSHPSGHLFGGAVDHFVGYGNVREGGLADLPGALARVMAGGPDYISIQPGAARHLWPQYAGKAALVIQAGCFTPDDRIRQLIATPEDAVRYGADALAVAIPVRGDTEGRVHPLADRHGQRRGPLRDAGHRPRLSPGLLRRRQDRLHPGPDRLCGAHRLRDRGRRDQGRIHRRLRIVPARPWPPARCRSSSPVVRRPTRCWAR